MPGTRVERPNPNSIPRYDAEGPAKIQLRLGQRKRNLRSLLRGFRRDAKQDNPTTSRQASAENELAEILVECQKDSLLLLT